MYRAHIVWGDGTTSDGTASVGGASINVVANHTYGAAGVFLLRARHTYPRDVATAAASHQGSDDPAPAPQASA